MTNAQNSHAGLATATASDALFARYVERLESIHGELAAKQARIAQDRNVDARFLEDAPTDEIRNIYAQRIEKSKDDFTRLDRHRARIGELLESARTASASLFLPVGAVVVSKEDYSISEDNWALDGSEPGPRPQKGSKGIVVGFNEQDDWAVKVVFFDDVEDMDGETTWSADRDGEALLIPFHAKDLEVLSLATFLDGTTCQSAEFLRTHISDDDGEENATMIVISDGVPIQITAYNIEDGNPWYQDAQAWSDLEQLKDFEPYEDGTISTDSFKV